MSARKGYGRCVLSHIKHSDRDDVDRHELIVYLHSEVGPCLCLM